MHYTIAKEINTDINKQIMLRKVVTETIISSEEIKIEP